MNKNFNHLVERAEKKVAKRAKKYSRQKMVVSGKSVFLLQRLAQERAAKLLEEAKKKKKK